MINSFLSGIRLFDLYKNVFSSTNIMSGAINYLSRRLVSFPVTVNLLITEQCNYSCRMCVSGRDHCNKGIDLDLAALKGFFQSIAPFRSIVHVGGGEPFVRKDILEIFALIKNSGLKCMATTNGYLMGRFDLSLVASSVDILIVSLYGPQEIHDRVVGVPGAFATTIRNIKDLIKVKGRGMRVMVSCVALPESVLAMPAFLMDLHALGVDAVKIEHLNFQTLCELKQSAPLTVNGFDLTPGMFTSEQDFQDEFVQAIVRLKLSLPGLGMPVHMKPCLSDPQVRDWYLASPVRDGDCRFITHSVFIDHKGDILPCQFLPHCVLGNIMKDSLQDVWNSQGYQRLRETIKQACPKVCLRCCKN